MFSHPVDNSIFGTVGTCMTINELHLPEEML